jgi:RNA polymerase sigma-70 factor (ECF subfamily)
MSATPADHTEHRRVLERMLTEQPDRLARKMRRAADDRAGADDLAQEVLLRAVRSLAGLRGPADEALLCGWVDTIASNLIRNQYRDRARRPHLEALDTAGPDEPAVGDTTDDLVMANAARDALGRLVDVLPPELRAVFIARVIDERPSAEVAASLGISDNLVRWRLHQARERLRHELDQLG